MEHLVPSIAFVKQIKQELQNGNSVHSSIENVCEGEISPFHSKIKLWLMFEKSGKEYSYAFTSDYQKTLLQILRSGLSGSPIIQHLVLLEKEMMKEFDRQWKAYLESQPFLLMIPLLLFFFPSYVVLLFGPLVMQFYEGVLS